eukprot:6067963-Prymnesium_polylepis.1
MNDANVSMNHVRVAKEVDAGVGLLARWWNFHYQKGLPTSRRRSDFGFAVFCHYRPFGPQLTNRIARAYRASAIPALSRTQMRFGRLTAILMS